VSDIFSITWGKWGFADGDDGMGVQKHLGGYHQVAFHPNHIIGVEVHVRIPAAARETGHTGMAVELEAVVGTEDSTAVNILWKWKRHWI
jgi:hypothetical protein